MTKDKALQMAIDFLGGSYEAHKVRKACQEALEQPTQDTEHKCEGCVKCDARCLPTQEPFGIWHVGDTEEESDFFLYKDSGDVSCKYCIKLYTHLKQWQGLSDDEIDAIFPLGDDVDVLDVARAVEAKLKEKNT